MGELHGMWVNLFFDVSIGTIAIILSLTAFSLNSEHTSFEMNTQLWETGRIRIIIPILQEAEVQRAPIFYFPLGWLGFRRAQGGV